jgi:hypothetical protein
MHEALLYIVTAHFIRLDCTVQLKPREVICGNVRFAVNAGDMRV